MYRNPYSNSYLAHYGVKGMKWGVRHDYEPIGRKKRVKNQTEDDSSQKDATESDKKKWSTKKKVLVAGAAIVAAYATYKFVDSGSAVRLMAKGKSFISGKNVIEFKQNRKTI